MSETSVAGILQYGRLPHVPCGAEHIWHPLEGPALHFVCEKAVNHPGRHGAGPFVEYSTEWPNPQSGEGG